MKQELGRVTIITMVEVHEDEDGDFSIDAGTKPSIEVEVDYPFSAEVNLDVARKAIKAAANSV